MDINDFKPKTAENLVKFEDGTAYSAAIRAGAKALIDSGRKDWRYSTQYPSGSTLWNHAGLTVIVTADGSRIKE